VLRRVLTCAVGVGVVVLAAACSPVKMGAAATVGSDRITVTQLDNQVAAFKQVYPKYASEVQLASSKIPGEVLSWLIRFQIRDRLAADSGITVTPAQVQAAINAINASGKAYAAQSGVTNYSLDLLLIANGIPPGLADDLGRYQAIQTAYLTMANGGTPPTSTSAASAATSKMSKAECSAAKSLNIQVSPQFGTFSYSQYAVTATPDVLSATSGSKPTAVSAGSC
jgi:hypothetical protein